MESPGGECGASLGVQKYIVHNPFLFPRPYYALRFALRHAVADRRIASCAEREQFFTCRTIMRARTRYVII